MIFIFAHGEIRVSPLNSVRESGLPRNENTSELFAYYRAKGLS
jgi:hypothetical protein